jgi:hypothetical protein
LRQTRGLASYSLHGRMGNGGRGYWDRSSQTNFSGTGCPRLVVTVKLLPASVRHWGRRLRNRDFSPVSGLCGLNMGIMSNKHYRLADKRPLTTEERTLLDWLVAHGLPNARRYAAQLGRVTVASRCTCGCPTIDLAVDGNQTSWASELIADAEGRSPEGISVGVILYCREGQLSELEVYPIDEVKGPFALPNPSTLVPLSDTPQ